MFTHEEIIVLDELGGSTVDEAVEVLIRNIDEAEDDLVKEFLRGLVDKIAPLSNEEFWYYTETRDTPIDAIE